MVLTRSANELHKRIQNITDTMRVVAEKTIDVSGLLTRSGDDPGTVTANENKGPGILGSKTFEVEDVPQVNAGSSEVLIYWESRGGPYDVKLLPILNTVVRELDDRCIVLRNNLLLGNKILDEQQTTIASITLLSSSRVAQNRQDNLQRQLAAIVAKGPDRTSSNKKTDAPLMRLLMTVFVVLLAFLMTRVGR